MFIVRAQKGMPSSLHSAKRIIPLSSSLYHSLSANCLRPPLSRPRTPATPATTSLHHQTPFPRPLCRTPAPLHRPSRSSTLSLVYRRPFTTAPLSVSSSSHSTEHTTFSASDFERDPRIRTFFRPMPRSYADAVDKLNGLQTNFAALEAVRKSGGSINKHSLKEVVDFVERIGYKTEDLNDLHFIHVTGTKGKGSTCALTESILRHYKGPKPIKTGLYTSPHLMEVRERIRINGTPISQDLFAKYFFEVWDRLEATADKSKPGYFRFLTLLAFHAFKQEKVDVAILEVGVGGAYDSTNIIQKPIVCGVSALGLDHISVLGSTIQEIAWNKGGIFKPDTPAFTSPQPQEGLDMLESRAKELHAASLKVAEPFTKEDLGSLQIGLAGQHQVANAALAVQLSKTWIEKVLGDKIEIREGESRVPKAFEAGLANARWPGRGQIIVRENKPKITWFFDGAHTAESLQVCAEWFKKASADQSAGKKIKRVLVFNCTGPRDGDKLLAPLARIQEQVHFDEAVFTPTITYASNTYKGDLVNNNAPIDLELNTQKGLAASWRKQLQIALENRLVQGKNDRTTVLPSIEHSVNWIDDYVAQQTKAGGEADEVQVLVTGSLHLVGGVQSVLGCDVL